MGKKMTILFDLTALYDHLSGIERFAMNISRNIIKTHKENNYILIFKNEIHESFLFVNDYPNVKVHILPACHKFLFHQWRLMRLLYKCKADRYIFLSFVSPWLFRSKKIINTIHDISAWDCPQTRKKHMVLYDRVGIRNAIRVSKNIVSVSEFTKGRLVEKLGVDKNKIHVVYNGVSEQFINKTVLSADEEKEVVEKYDLPENYILCLSTLEPRKNMKLLIKAFVDMKKKGQIKCDLVLAGRKGWKLEDALGDVDCEKNIHVTGYIEDKDLPVIYSKAQVFVFPSLYEGFGIPLIEAMSCDTVVVCSDSSSLPEVVGDAGILFRNKSVSGLEKALSKVLAFSEDERNELIAKGQQRIKKFVWEDEAEKYYRTIIK